MNQAMDALARSMSRGGSQSKSPHPDTSQADDASGTTTPDPTTSKPTTSHPTTTQVDESKVETNTSPEPTALNYLFNTVTPPPVITDVDNSVVDGYQTKEPSMTRAFEADKEEQHMSKTVVVPKKKSKAKVEKKKPVVKE